MKISLGVITKRLDGKNHIIEFIKNIKKYGHEVNDIIIGYAENIDDDFYKELRKHINVILVNAKYDINLLSRLKDIGINKDMLEYVIYNSGEKHVPYGMMRNNVILEAILKRNDYLVFIDTDVRPVVLLENGEFGEVDFLGHHLDQMRRKDVYITTSDYSGYYIVPPIKYNKLADLLIGVGKERAMEMILKDNYDGINYDSGNKRKVFETNKILGGNLMINLKVFKDILPFFSSFYKVKGEEYLTRGEDTVLGLEIEKRKYIKCIDIDLKIFHDTYFGFPKIVNIYEDKDIKDRFYYACIGWIGRNPFMYWINNVDTRKMYEIQREKIKLVSKDFAKHINDSRFEILPEALENSYRRLDEVVEEYNIFCDNWYKIVQILERREFF